MRAEKIECLLKAFAKSIGHSYLATNVSLTDYAEIITLSYNRVYSICGQHVMPGDFTNVFIGEMAVETRTAYKDVSSIFKEEIKEIERKREYIVNKLIFLHQMLKNALSDDENINIGVRFDKYADRLRDLTGEEVYRLAEPNGEWILCIK